MDGQIVLKNQHFKISIQKECFIRILKHATAPRKIQPGLALPAAGKKLKPTQCTSQTMQNGIPPKRQCIDNQPLHRTVEGSILP